MKILLLMSVLLTSNAFAWGPTGHRVVGEVAERYVDTDVLLKIYKIIGTNSMANLATWADEIRSEPQTYAYTYEWHYTEWPDDMAEYDEEHADGKLIKAIHEQVAVLKDLKSTPTQKLFAIKFVIHLVGDVHQPLHVGNGMDSGANYCKVKYFGRIMNLHALWDEGLIDGTKLSFTELSKFVAQGRSAEEIRSWKSGTVLDWARESKNLRPSIYPEEVSGSSKESGLKSYCQKDVSEELMPNLSYEYAYKVDALLKKRLFQGGLRLALILNQALK